MFVYMKSILCLLTVFLMSAVSYGTTPVTTNKKEVLKVAVIGMGANFAQAVAVAEKVAMSKNETVIIAFVNDVGSCTAVEMANEAICNYRHEVEKIYFISDYDYTPFLPDAKAKPKYFYGTVAPPTNSKACPGKLKHTRKARNAI